MMHVSRALRPALNVLANQSTHVAAAHFSEPRWPAREPKAADPSCLTRPPRVNDIDLATALHRRRAGGGAVPGPRAAASCRFGTAAPRALLLSRVLLGRSWSQPAAAPRLLSRRGYSSGAVDRAHALLELPPSFSAKQLKQAYLRQCRRLHPDHSAHGKAAATELFVEMAAAFDLLKGCVEQFDTRAAAADARAAADEGAGGEEGGGAAFDDEEGFAIKMTAVEEEAYRDSCMQWVHLSAELVEELKADPGFREWLKGNCSLFRGSEKSS